MSADNWRVCPKCLREAKAEQERKRKFADEQYGKVDADTYLKLRAEAEREVETEEALREDYQIGITDEGTFFVHYTGSCQSCDFNFEFRHEETPKQTARGRR